MTAIARQGLLWLSLVVLATAASTSATSLLRVNLNELCDQADRIFRGTVVDAVPGTVEVGGGRLPTLTYIVRVEETFKGEFPGIKGQPLAEVRMLGKQAPLRSGSVERVQALPEMPRMEVGQRYLLFATRPSPVGLSTAVGLGQGCFHVRGPSGKEVAVNEFGNVGLFDEMEAAESAGAGPISYARLGAEIRAALARGRGTP